MLTGKHLAAVQQAELWKGLSQPEIAALIERAGVSHMRFAQGEIIFAPLQYQNCLGILISGSATVQKLGGAHAMLMSILRAGELFGAATLFCQKPEPYVVSIRAAATVEALLISEEALTDMMHTDVRIMKNYLSYLTGRIRFLNQRLDGFVKPTVEDRLMLFLENSASNGVCELPFGMQSLADALCIGRATLYRALDSLDAKGSIRRCRRTIMILRKEEKQNEV